MMKSTGPNFELQIHVPDSLLKTIALPEKLQYKKGQSFAGRRGKFSP